MNPVFYERRPVQLVELSHEREKRAEADWEPYHDNEITTFERMPSIVDLLDFMAGMDLKDQIYMTCNLLTIAGWTQPEIAEGLGVNYSTYRSRLMAVRKRMARNGITR